MIRIHLWVVTAMLTLCSICFSQIDTITIGAGTPEDKELTAIGNEQDVQKRISLYQDFIQKYAANPMAVAFGNWQLSQSYQAAGDFQKAIEAGDKALALSPHNLDILSSQVVIAQQLKDSRRDFQYCIQGGQAYNSIEKQTKPAGVSDEDFQTNIAHDKSAGKNSYDFFQAAAFGVISSESDAKTRMDYIEKFTAAFPKSGMDDQIASYAMMSLSDLKDNQRLIAYAEKVVASNPDNLEALLMLANVYMDSNNTAKAALYGQKAVAAAKADDPAAPKSRIVSAGMAHAVTGRAYATEGKLQPAIAELKSATSLLKGQDEQQYAVAAYFLGWAYAKSNRLADARAILTDASSIPGPVQDTIKDLLTKVNSARAAGK